MTHPRCADVIYLWSLLAATLLAWPTAALAQGGPPPALVRVREVSEQQLQSRFDVVGRLQEVRRAVVAAEVEGKVMEVLVDEGDRVVGGETVLARIDGVWTRLMRDAARANVASAQATYDQAKLDLKYLEQLKEANSAKQREVDNARAQVASDAAALDAAKVELARAEEMLRRLDVLAPFDGIVVEKTAEVGQWFDLGDPVCTVISRGAIDAVVGTPEALTRSLRRDLPIDVVIESMGMTLQGKVFSVTPLSLNAARTFPTKIRLDDQDGKLKAGMSVTARLPTSETDTFLTVPRNAIVRGDRGTSVWIVEPAPAPGNSPGSAPGNSSTGARGNGEGNGEANDQGPPMPTAKMVRVRVLFGAGDRMAVSNVPGGPALQAGDRVVVEGMEGLFPTRPLNIGGEGPDGVTPPGKAGADIAGKDSDA